MKRAGQARLRVRRPAKRKAIVAKERKRLKAA
jgi:hypothetical protein